MKKSTFVLLAMTISILFVFINIKFNDEPTDVEAEHLRALHYEALNKSPYANTQQLSKAERHYQSLPPNQYYEQLWELSLDPTTGRPMPENLAKIREKLKSKRAFLRGVGDADNPWIDRGPNNQGGRTRGIMFDPNDINNASSNDDYTRVFAGGVSGGLWVNDDITDEDSSWQLVNGMDGSISVNVIIHDPNNFNVFYIGTGESYTSGDAIGNGIWKSTDGGVNWNRIFGGYDGVSGNNVDGIFFVNDLIARNNNGVTELYAATSNAVYKYSDNPRQSHADDSNGLYKSVDGGDNWSRFDITTSGGTYKNTNDLELDVNNTIWMTTTSHINGSRGGDIYKSVDGIDFQLINTIPNARRTEIEISSNDPNKIWVAANINSQADLFKSTDGFVTFSRMNEPNDADGGIPEDDFTRGQAFYDLVIEADANDNLIVGGIDLFRTTDGGDSWSQISKWANTTELGPLNIPLVHADQHAVVFRPGSNTKIVFGNDGGVYYSDNILVAGFNEDAITARNKDYNTIQFYVGSIDGSDSAGLTLAGGTQDNGTQVKVDAVDGANAFIDPFGGDGAYTELDGEDGYLIQSYYFNDHRFQSNPESNRGYRISTLQTDDSDNGNFINIAELDKRNDIFYSNASLDDNYRIEKISNFKNGSENIESQFITHPQLNDRPSAIKSSPFISETSNIYVGLKTGKLFKVKLEINGNSNLWTEITGPNFVGSISDIELGKSEDEIFVTMHNYGVASIWFSADSGTSWRNIEGNLPDIPVRCILQNPLEPKELIIGTELGVWFTDDYTASSPNWEQSYNGMSDITVVDLDLRPSDNLVLATTHGRGMFTSNFTAQSLSIANIDDLEDRFKIFPTVSNGDITIISALDASDAKVSIFDLFGKIVHKTNLNLGNFRTELNLNLSAGLYFVNIDVDNYTETKRIVLE